ncbi:MAG: DUF839 domain-containing protein, partial [Bacteroidetes bacterium]|nr:DUF839 domain-containing protein [Bacteroidota bacterium]
MRLNFTPRSMVAGIAVVLLVQTSTRAQTISTVAGGGSSTNVQATRFGFDYPINAVLYPPTGDIYVNCNGDGAIRKINSSGIVTVVAGGNGPAEIADGPVTGSGSFSGLSGLVVDGAGNLYVTEFYGCRVRKISASGTISTIAGNGTQGFSGDGGIATSAQLWYPLGIAIDGSGNLYVVDLFNNRIRKITTGGIITTFAGNGTAGFGGDGGAATSAQLNQPEGVAIDGAGNVYIADTYNHRIRQVSVGGIINTYAGTGVEGFSGDGGPAARAQLGLPNTFSIDGFGNLYITDQGNADIRKVKPDGTISTIAGNGIQGFSGDGASAIDAQLNYPWGTFTNASGNLVICDEENKRLREIGSDGTINTIAGNGGNFIGNNGPATDAVLYGPKSLFADHLGNIYFPDDKTVLRVDRLGIISTVLYRGFKTSCVYGDAKGNIYVGCAEGSEYIIDSVPHPGGFWQIAGNGANSYYGDGGSALQAAIGTPRGITEDTAGNIFFSDSDHAVIRKVTPEGIISTFAGTGHAGYGGDGGGASLAQFGAPNSICSDASGNIYVADNHPNSVRRIDPSGVITTVAGGNNFTTGNSGDGGPATSALFGDIQGLACDAIGDLFIVDAANNRVRRVDASTGIISAFAGSGTQGFAGDGGPALAAEFNAPMAAALDSHGDLYIGDAHNLRIRKVTIPYTLPNITTTITQAITDTFSTDVNDNSFHRVASISPRPGVNALVGNVTFSLISDPAIQLFNGHPYVTRHYDITPADNASTAQATVTLYFTQSEFDDYNNYVNIHGLGLPSLPTDATILQFHGTGTAPGNYAGGAEMIKPTVHFNAVNNWWEISFPVNGFSGFFLTSGSVPLPLHLLSFAGLLEGSNVTLNWITADEKGAKIFRIERSSNVKDFVTIGQVAAKDVAGLNGYKYVDESVAAGVWY